MAYTPIGWQTGDTITAEKMNKMDNGWEVSSTQLFSESVTTVAGEYGNEAELTYANTITADSITVTFDGNEYTCPVVSMSGVEHGYGGVDSSWAYDFSQYPFAIVTNEMNGKNIFATQTAGTYTVAVSTKGIEMSDNFNSAVNNCVDTSTMPMLCVSGTTTFVQMRTAYAQGRMLYFSPFSNIIRTLFITSFGESNVNFIPELTGVSATFVNGVFTVGV